MSDCWVYINIYLINISTELEKMSNAQQIGGKAYYIKHCKCA